MLVVGSSARGREIHDALEASGLHVVGHVASAAAAPHEESVDVVLVVDDRLLDEGGDEWRDGLAPAVVVRAGDDRAAAPLASLGLRGWAVVGRDAPATAIAVAVVAAANGFAVKPATSDAGDAEEAVPIERLTAREREVLELVSEGLPNKAIAARLGVSDHTVKFHLSSIFSKLGVSTRTEAVRAAVRAGLISF